MISGAIFDVDGTLLDSMPVWHNCGVRYLKSIGIEAEPGLGDFLFTQTNESGAVYMVDHYGLDIPPEEVAEGMSRDMENYYFNQPAMKEGAAEILERFSEEGIPMTVATSTDRYLLEGAVFQGGALMRGVRHDEGRAVYLQQSRRAHGHGSCGDVGL